MLEEVARRKPGVSASTKHKDMGVYATKKIIPKERAATARYNKHCVALVQCGHCTRSIIPLLVSSGNKLPT